MTAPSALAATLTSGETRAPTTEQLTRIAHSVLDHFGYEMTRSHISRLVRRFQVSVAGSGWSFFDYTANAIRLDAHQRREALLDPDVARAISYADPTGETAVRNVMRAR